MNQYKILSLEKLSRRCVKLKEEGKKIVLANGCFDLIHVGHVRYLEGAAALGNVLIVAINSDKSVRSLKGPGRPFLSQSGRAAMVAGFECVDFVIVFSQPTVENVLRSIQPDVHAKGTDYTEETVPERDLVKAYGGLTMIVGDPKDHSTRDLIRKIQDNEALKGAGRKRQ
ncbi:MAG TPA: adenylyltransferase/cytidyltransferase family protein [Acidobacteriota bacterium]